MENVHYTTFQNFRCRKSENEANFIDFQILFSHYSNTHINPLQMTNATTSLLIHFQLFLIVLYNIIPT